MKLDIETRTEQARWLDLAWLGLAWSGLAVSSAISEPRLSTILHQGYFIFSILHDT